MSGIIGVSPDMRSGVVGAWPSGHVIQTIHKIDKTTGEINRTSTGSDAPSGSGLKTSISCTSGNIVLVNFYVHWLMNDPQYSFYATIYKGGSRLTHSTTQNVYEYVNTSGNQMTGEFSISVIDETAPTTSTEYELWFWNGNTLNYNRLHATDIHPAFITLTEIQQ